MPERTVHRHAREPRTGRLIRFVVGPDAPSFPTSRRKLPGRGVWVTARAELSTRRSGARRLRAGFKAQGDGRPTLPARSTGCWQRDCLQALSLANKAGAGRHGLHQGRERRSRTAPIALLLHASDASADGRAQDRAGAAARQFGAATAAPDDQSFRLVPIGFGIGAGKCDTCSALREPASRGLSRTVPHGLPPIDAMSRRGRAAGDRFGSGGAASA